MCDRLRVFTGVGVGQGLAAGSGHRGPEHICFRDQGDASEDYLSGQLVQARPKRVQMSLYQEDIPRLGHEQAWKTLVVAKLVWSELFNN